MKTIQELNAKLDEFCFDDIRFDLPSGKPVVIQRKGSTYVVIGLGYECVVYSRNSLFFILKSYNVPYNNPEQGVAS